MKVFFLIENHGLFTSKYVWYGLSVVLFVKHAKLPKYFKWKHVRGDIMKVTCFSILV